MPKFDSVCDLVAQMEGKRVIKKILVANNGMAATKGMPAIITITTPLSP